MFVVSCDRFVDVGDFDPVSGVLDVYPRARVAGRPMVFGSFAWLSGQLCVFYRFEGVLWLQVGDRRWPLEDGFSVEWVSFGDELSELVVRDKSSDEDLVRISYQPTGQLYDDDVTPFVEREHFDFGLFVWNVLNDEDRRRRIYAKDL